jgi:hypothetical protein
VAVDIAQAIHQLPLAVFLRTNPLAYPLVESLHLVSIALLFGSVAVVDLRILGLTRNLSLRQLARHALPWTMLAFLFAAATGSLLFVAHAADLINNRLFIAKLFLLSLAGTNAVMFHTGPYVNVSAWDVGIRPPASARAMAAASLIIWVGVIFCGRWIAYA